MRKMKVLVALVLAMTLVLSVASVALAKTNGTVSDGTGSITIANASKGVTYKVFKLFDATVSTGAINYTGTIPGALADYFTKDDAGNISKNSAKSEAEIVAAVQSYVENLADTDAVVSDTGDGTPLTFAGLQYGYYGVKSSQGATVTIDSTNPNATIYDKNSTTITVEKTVGDTSYSIGDTITYTATFGTTNYIGSGEDAKQVIEYEIQDTLPEFLDTVNVTSITVGGTPITTQQFSEKKIIIPWATEDAGSDPKTYTNIYANGAELVITYTAVLTDVTNINAFDTNTVSIHPTTWNGTSEEHPWDDHWQDDATITTYAAALKKTDGSNPLPGAQFTIKGLVVKAGGAAGEYIVVSYDANSDTQSAVLDTNDDGKLYIVGLADDVTLVVTEYKAPDGYNKLTHTVDVPAQVMSKEIYHTSGTIYYDAKGNVVSSESSSTSSKTDVKNLTDLDATAVEVVNNAGTELPSTGGIGTTIFYIAGIVLVLGAAAVVIARRKAEQE